MIKILYKSDKNYIISNILLRLLIILINKSINTSNIIDIKTYYISIKEHNLDKYTFFNLLSYQINSISI